MVNIKYPEFVKYIEKIVLYQARNKKHASWSLARKCELNFTTRQLAVRCNVSHMTISRWIKKAIKDGVLNYKYRKLKTKALMHRDMRFYTVNRVVRILRSIAKKKVYNIVKTIIKNKPENVTLKYILKNINISKHSGTKFFGKTKLNILASPDFFDFMVPLGKNGAWVNLSEFDARIKTVKKKQKRASEKFEKEMFDQMFKCLA